jgi:Ca2+-binding EF-hand superfamily protein
MGSGASSRRLFPFSRGPEKTAVRIFEVPQDAKHDVTTRSASHLSVQSVDGRRSLEFPTRTAKSKLSQALWQKLEELFKMMDADGSNSVTRDEARKFFKGAFGKLSADAMFNEVDVDLSGVITSEEFINFWIQVRAAGYEESDMLDEINELIAGGTWVDWNDGRNTTAPNALPFPKRPLLCKLSSTAWQRCKELFQKMDPQGTNVITWEMAESFCNTSSAEAMFKEVDVDRQGVITAKQFMDFWVQVKARGYKDKEIMEKLQSLNEGNSWVSLQDRRAL